MKRLHAFLPTTALVLILAGCNSGTSTGDSAVADKPAVPAEGVDFKLVAAKGDVQNYKVTMTMDGKGPTQPGVPGEFKVTADMKQTMKVTGVKDGNMDFETSFTDVKATGTAPFADAIASSLKSTVTKMTVDSKGRVVKEEGAGDANSMSSGMIYFPDKKVKVGDTWERSTPTGNGQNVTAKYKFEGTEKVDGIETAMISVTPVTPGAEASGKFTYWIDMSNGMAVKGNGEIKSTAGGGSMTMGFDMTRI